MTVSKALISKKRQMLRCQVALKAIIPSWSEWQSHHNCRDPREIYIYCIVLPLIPQQRQMTSIEWYSIIHRGDLILHSRQKCIFQKATTELQAQNSLWHLCWYIFTHYRRIFSLSRSWNVSVLACWRLSTCFPVLSSFWFLHLQSTALLYWFFLCRDQQCKAIQPFRSISHGSTLITWLWAVQLVFPARISCCITRGLQIPEFCKQLLFGQTAFQKAETGFSFVGLFVLFNIIPFSSAHSCQYSARILQSEPTGMVLSTTEESWNPLAGNTGISDNTCCGWRTSLFIRSC